MSGRRGAGAVLAPVSLHAPKDSSTGTPPKAINGRGLGLSLPAIGFMTVFYAYPLVQMLVLSVFDPEFTTRHYARIIETPGYIRVIFNTFQVSVIVTIVCLVVGYPLAYLLARASPRTVNVLLLVLAFPFMTSILVRTYGWMILLQRTGLVNATLQWLGIISEPAPLMYNRIGVSTGMVHVLLPYMVLPLFSVMRGIDWNLLRVAQVLGATPFGAFWRVFVPLTFPGIGAGCLLVFISGLGFFVTPALLGGLKDIMIAMVIQTQAEAVGNWAFSAALAVVLLGMTGGVLALLQLRRVIARLHGRRVSPGVQRDGGMRIAREVVWWVRRGPRKIRQAALVWANAPGVAAVGSGLAGLTRGEPPRFLYLVCAMVVLFLIAPLCVVIPISFSKARFLNFPPPGYSLQWYGLLLSSREWSAALATSLEVGLATTVLALVLGTLAAYSFVRARTRARGLLYGFLLSPMIIPHIAIAIAMYFAFRRLEIAGSVLGLVLGHTVVALPFVFVIMVSTFEGLDENLEYAAASLGATPLQRWRRVVVPLVTPGLVSGSILAFMASFDDVIIALFLSGTRTLTLPRKLWTEVGQSEPSPVVAAVSTLLIVVSVITVVGLELLRRRSRGAFGVIPGARERPHPVSAGA